eukprot:3295190-Rhodomonas_salina.1
MVRCADRHRGRCYNGFYGFAVELRGWNTNKFVPGPALNCSTKNRKVEPDATSPGRLRQLEYYCYSYAAEFKFTRPRQDSESPQFLLGSKLDFARGTWKDLEASRFGSTRSVAVYEQLP